MHRRMTIKVPARGKVEKIRAKIQRLLKITCLNIPLARPCAQSIIVAFICFNSPAADLEWVQGPGFRSAMLPVPRQGKTGFTLLPPGTTGINFTNILTDEKTAENQLRLNGSGVA